MKKHHTSIRVFESPMLERLTHVHPLTPLVLWLPIVSWLIWRSFNVHQLSAFYVGGLAALGLFFWTFAEYILHRYIFHFLPETPLQERLSFLIHGLHHADPVDPTRLVMPPVGSLFLGVVLFGLFRFLLGVQFVEPFFAGFVLGYLAYDYIHFSVHHFTPRTRIGKFLKQHHMMHHFVSPDFRWGVSSPLWDYVFGTVEEPKRVTHGS